MRLSVVFTLVIFVAWMSFSLSALAAKAIRPLMGPDHSVTTWQEVEISDERVPLGVNERPDAQGVFGYPDESMGLNVDPRKAGVDTSKPLTHLSVVCAGGDALPESGPWDARCYVQHQTSCQGMETAPLRDWVGECQIDLIDKKGRLRRRKMVQFRRPYYGENGVRYKSMVSYFEPDDFRGISSLVCKPVDEAQGDDQWVYLPAFRRVRRIPASQKMDMPAGMDLSYDQLDRATGMWDMRIIEEKTIYVDQQPLNNCYGSEPHRAYLDGRHCVVVEMVPRKKRWRVSRDILYFDKISAACYYEEIYNKKGKLERIALPFMAHLYPKNPAYWTLGDLYAHNLDTNHKTRIGPAEFDRSGEKAFDYTTRDWSNCVFWYDTGLSEEYFSQQFMTRGTR